MLCYVNPDGSHVRGCYHHWGGHPYDRCEADERRTKRIADLKVELQRLENAPPRVWTGEGNRYGHCG